jgi:hypothetical protein
MRVHGNAISGRDADFENADAFVFKEKFVMVGRGNHGV